MTDSKTEEIQSILSDVDEYLRQRLKLAGVTLHHIVLAAAPDCTGIVRSSVDPQGLRDMAALLKEIADNVESRSDGEPLN